MPTEQQLSRVEAGRGGRLRIVVLGMMGRCPYGGQTWGYLNWLLGLHRLGHEVWYVEDDSVWPFDPVQNAITNDGRYAASHIASCMERIGLAGRWVYRLFGQPDACWGLDPAAIQDLYRSCDLLLNIAGAVELREEHLAARLRVYVQTDPVTPELRLAGGDARTRESFAAHHVIATYGENFGAPDCGVPLNGIEYIKTRQPIDLEWWPVSFDAGARSFTTIGNYRQLGSDVPFDGEWYRWSKHHEWEKILDLPRRTTQRFELAMPVTPADRTTLERHGWNIVSPLAFSLDIFGAYRDYYAQSRAELTVAKDQNVRLRSGWFSDRDASYLATGKPVVAQDTAFDCVLPVGEGLFSFSTIDEALAAIDAINSDYPRHCAAARAIAEEYFDSVRVAARLLDDIDRAGRVVFPSDASDLARTLP